MSSHIPATPTAMLWSHAKSFTVRGRTFLMGNTRPECFPQKGPKFWDPLFFQSKFWDPLFFPYKFDTPYFTQKLGLSAFLISEIVTIFAIFGSVTSKKMEILKKFWSNFEIDLRPLKFSPKNLRPLIFLPENLRPLKKHSGRVFPINNVHPLK